MNLIGDRGPVDGGRKDRRTEEDTEDGVVT